MNIPTLVQIRDDFWSAAFRNGTRCGVMRDGIYDINVDRDWLVMFCGGAI
jgi:hypothetical protein